MAKSRTKKGRKAFLGLPDLQRKTWIQVAGITLLGFSLFYGLSMFSSGAGILGSALDTGSKKAFGLGSYVLLLIFFFFSLFLIWKNEFAIDGGVLVGLALIFLSFESIFHLSFLNGKDFFGSQIILRGGGYLGGALTYVLLPVFGKPGVWIISLTEMLVGAVIVGEFSINKLLKSFAGGTARGWKLIPKIKREETGVEKKKPRLARKPRIKISTEHLPSEDFIAEQREVRAGVTDVGVSEEPLPIDIPAPDFKSYVLPPVDLLKNSVPVDSPTYRKKVDDMVGRIEKTLASFDIEAEVTQVIKGPTVTRYELQLGSGIKVNKIVALSDDLSMALASANVHVLAPIPGRSAVGIDVPNTRKEIVTLGDIFRTAARPKELTPLTIGFGKDIAGKSIFAGLDDMPHLLIAGATGSGKSGCLNAIISSIMLNARPDQVKMILIDPKKVEFHQFQGLPHLMTPVVTDKKRAASSLGWAVSEMDSRFKLLSEAGEKNISAYNDMLKKSGKTAIPFIVVIIDELADLMMVSPSEVEDAICRLAQMARAVGIYLVVATQRPSVDVITGLIKTNIPSRISFAVSSQMDSRVILDSGGAEKLLGRGDMLFKPAGAIAMQRLQGAFVSENEIDLLVGWCKKQSKPEYNEEVIQDSKRTGKIDFEDELLDEAMELIVMTGQASTSMLQRRLRIGYSRAARIIDILEDRGVVGAADGSKPRAVLFTLDDIETMKRNRGES